MITLEQVGEYSRQVFHVEKDGKRLYVIKLEETEFNFYDEAGVMLYSLRYNDWEAIRRGKDGKGRYEVFSCETRIGTFDPMPKYYNHCGMNLNNSNYYIKKKMFKNEYILFNELGELASVQKVDNSVEPDRYVAYVVNSEVTDDIICLMLLFIDMRWNASASEVLDLSDEIGICGKPPKY